MANWMRTLDMRDVWASDDIPKIARTAAKRLKKLLPFVGEPEIENQKEDLILGLEDLASDPTATARDFDYIWNDVYDWADASLDGNWNGKKVCWIKMF